MNKETSGKLADYYREAESWAADRERSRFRSLRIAWSVAAIASVVALFEAIALIALTPLKTVVPYTLLVDRQTGYVQALKPLEQDKVAPDAALTRSLLAQYVIAREGFDIDGLRENYRRVALWSEGEVRNRYIAGMLATNPSSPLATLPRRALVQVEIRSISSLNNDTALVRFVTTRIDPGGQPQEPQAWASVINYHFSGAAMTEADRLSNPLGFQVIRYNRSAEIPPAAPETGPARTSVVQPTTAGSVQSHLPANSTQVRQ